MARSDSSRPARRQVIIDTDPGQDDALALLLALGSDLLDIVAITTVSGNAPIEITQRNARVILDWAGKIHVPVFAGCAQPMIKPFSTTPNIHGETGLQGAAVHDPKTPLQAEHAVDFLIRSLREARRDSVTLCLLAPMTNIAQALKAAPEIALAISEIVIMGGAYSEHGNVTPSAEFNFFIDPHAADVILNCGRPTTIISCDVGVQAAFGQIDVRLIRGVQGRCSKIAADIMDAQLDCRDGPPGTKLSPMYDPCAIAYLVEPSLFEGVNVNVVVETTGTFTEGETVVDFSGKTGRLPNVRWLVSIERHRFYRLFAETVSNLP